MVFFVYEQDKSDCLERIHTIRSAFHNALTLVENERFNLQNLLIEAMQQHHICSIMEQLLVLKVLLICIREELRGAPLRVDIAIAAGNYEEAAKIITTSSGSFNTTVISLLRTSFGWTLLQN